MMDQVLNYNKIIAEFMGSVFKTEELTSSGGEKVVHSYWTKPDFFDRNMMDCWGFMSYQNLGEMKYSKSWDWIMPVVEKINSLQSGASFPYEYNFIVDANCVRVERQSPYGRVNPVFIYNEIQQGNVLIEIVYKTVVEFIVTLGEYK